MVLAVGHSARLLYDRMLEHGVNIETKPIAVGFRIEHPQELINKIQYGEFGRLCNNGKGPVPVADYRLAVQVKIEGGDGADKTNNMKSEQEDEAPRYDERACYSFCMCPGGQIVPTSVNPEELCVNGMSFSQRQSKWANSAIVVGVRPGDMIPPEKEQIKRYAFPKKISSWSKDDPLRGVFWQEFSREKGCPYGWRETSSPSAAGNGLYDRDSLRARSRYGDLQF